MTIWLFVPVESRHQAVEHNKFIKHRYSHQKNVASTGREKAAPFIKRYTTTWSNLVKIEVINNEDPLVFETLVSGVREHNQSALGFESKQPLSVILRDDNEKIIGGVSGCTIYKHFLVNLLWVDKVARNQGLARKVMELAEREAKRRGCIAAQVDTLSIQAPNFYQKLGFEVEGKIPGLTEDHDRYFLMKQY